MWKTINTVLGKKPKTTSIAVVEFENKQLTDKKEIASAFIKDFTNVGPLLAEKIEDKLNDDPVRFIPSNEEVVEFKFKPVTKQNILTALRGLKDSKSPGPDRIPAKILTDAAELICGPLKTIFNESLEIGIFSDTVNPRISPHLRISLLPSNKPPPKKSCLQISPHRISPMGAYSREA